MSTLSERLAFKSLQLQDRSCVLVAQSTELIEEGHSLCRRLAELKERYRRALANSLTIPDTATDIPK
jgi:hypothetical protein